MTLFLRDKDNKTLADISLYKASDGYIELSSSVIIDNYSNFLLNAEEEKRNDIITYFDVISELRGWLWEKYFMGRKNTFDEYDNVVKELRKILDTIAKETGLHRVED